jgi:hypothetical protein
MNAQDQQGTPRRQMLAGRRQMVSAVNRCLLTVYERDREQPLPERLMRVLAELGHRARIGPGARTESADPSGVAPGNRRQEGL